MSVDHPTVVSRSRLSLDVLMPRPDPAGLRTRQVSYQAWQFLHLELLADVAWLGNGRRPDASIAWDELSFLTDDGVRRRTGGELFVLVLHDWWCHPLRIVEELHRRERPFLLLRHTAAKRLFDFVAPDIPSLVDRPGVETSVFHPHDGSKPVDILLSGSETPDYPVRQRLNRIVRERSADYGWNVLDLTGVGLMSNPPGTQAEYAPALAAAKISPTGTNRGGGPGGALALQYFDFSAARAQFDDPFYGLGTPELAIVPFESAGVTPRYLESLASKTLLLGDLPAGESEEWYRDKMVVIDEAATDDEIAETIDRWVRDDEAREDLVEAAYRATLATETAEIKAHDLLEMIDERA